MEKAGLLDEDGNPNFSKVAKEYVADIVVITQFALIELLLKKLTTDHGLNQWFTPIIKLDVAFQNEIVKLGKTVGKGISKLIYVRLRKVISKGKEETVAAFNIDTYPFVAKFATDAIALAAGNLLAPTQQVAQSQIDVDIFSEIIATIDFPQQDSTVVTPTNDDNHYNIKSLLDNRASPNTTGKSQKES